MHILIVISITLIISLAHNNQQYNWQSVEDVVNYYLMEGAYKGGILRVSNGSDTIYNYPFGHLTNN